jgi:hypothetical protein
MNTIYFLNLRVSNSTPEQNIYIMLKLTQWYFLFTLYNHHVGYTVS